MDNKGLSPDQVDNSLDKIRELIVGQDDKYVHQVIKRDAKGLVTDVVSEALHERETKDGSVNKVLVPLVEKSLHRSIDANSEKIVGTLYPLVGALVRKAVSAFLIDFVERTNALIENSLSPKSLSWRFKAWQSGVRYSEYVASQVYQYQVQQLFIIHRETGTLLQTISSDPSRTKDADLISSMLVAINDFVADSFSSSNEEAENELGEIKTGDFTLLIKLGPQAILVAAVVGVVPPEIRSKLQQALEDFHHFYQVPLQEYNGDNAPFSGSETLLNDCLVSAKKEEAKGKRKYLAGSLIIGCGLLFVAYLGFLRMQLAFLQDKIVGLSPPAGIILTSSKIEDGNVELDILRDPFAQSPHDWLESNKINTHNLIINEAPFASLHNGIIRKKLDQLVDATPEINASTTPDDVILLEGKLTIDAYNHFIRELNAISGISQLNLDTSGISLNMNNNSNAESVNYASLKSLAGQISSIQINFELNQEEIDTKQLPAIKHLAQQLLQLQDMAQQLNLSVAVFIMGASDNSGSAAHNLALSKLRANNVKEALLAMNIDPGILFPMGLGQLSLNEASMGRTVFVNVLVSNSYTNEASSK